MEATQVTRVSLSYIVPKNYAEDFSSLWFQERGDTHIKLGGFRGKLGTDNQRCVASVIKYVKILWGLGFTLGRKKKHSKRFKDFLLLNKLMLKIFFDNIKRFK